MKELAVYLMLVLGGNATPSKSDVETALSAVGLEASDRLDALMAEMEGKDLHELLEAGTERLAKFGGGGGGGGGGGAAAGGGAEEEAKEEEPEEEEADIGGGMDMFGGDEGGDY